MSFKSAMQGTQVNQNYRRNASQLNNIDRAMQNDRLDFNQKEKKRGNMIDVFGSATKLMGTVGDNLGDWGKNIDFAKENKLKSGGMLNMLNPFKEGGFGQTYSNEDTDPMTIGDLGKTRNLMENTNIFSGDDSLSFKDASSVSMSENPMQSLMAMWNSKRNKPVETKVKTEQQKVIDNTVPDSNTPVTNTPITNTPITNTPITNTPITNTPITTDNGTNLDEDEEWYDENAPQYDENGNYIFKGQNNNNSLLGRSVFGGNQ